MGRTFSYRKPEHPLLPVRLVFNATTSAESVDLACLRFERRERLGASARAFAEIMGGIGGGWMRGLAKSLVHLAESPYFGSQRGICCQPRFEFTCVPRMSLHQNLQGRRAVEGVLCLA